MADLPSEFWGGYIVILTVVSFVAAVWLVLSVYFAPESKAEAPTETWDENLKEGFEPPPMWWFWLTIALMAFSVIYLMLYPGLGTFNGALEWSQGGEITEKFAEYEERFGAERERLAAMSAAELGSDERAMESAWNIFNVHCAACHGADAGGQAKLFPNLGDDVWQWGSGDSQIEQTIMNGRQGVMPPWQTALGDDGVAGLTDYTIALSEGRADDPALAESATAYLTYCSACHAADGSGNTLLGAPALNDDVWLYGDEREAIAESIALGRTGMMPAYRDRLDAAQIRLLTAWIAAGAVPRLPE